MSQLIGKSIYNFHHTGDDTPILTFIDNQADAEMNPSLFFRSHRKMNRLEKTALRHCKGKILDVGAAAGCHALYLQEKGFDVTALEISSQACEVMQKRGIKKVIHTDIFQHGAQYDTILLLMNGFGMAQSHAQLGKFIAHLKKLLAPGGQIIGDSTDIYYYHQKRMLQKDYFGDVEFRLEYKGESETFPWLYADEELLHFTAKSLVLKTQTLARNNSDAFLMRMSLE